METLEINFSMLLIQSVTVVLFVLPVISLIDLAKKK
jgi:hypothetical protein